MWKHSTKGQMEIFGLLMIVTLIILGVVFSLRFVVMKAPENVHQSFSQKGIANNMLGAILETEPLNCVVNEFSDLVADCVDFDSTLCGSIKSCDYLRQEIKNIFSASLDQWGYNYEFYIERGSNILINITQNGCPGEKDAAMQPLPGGVGIRFYVCQG